MGRRNSTRVDEGKKSGSILTRHTKARTVVGRGEESLLYVPGSEFRLIRGTIVDRTYGIQKKLYT